MYRGIESKLRKGLAWVATGLLQFSHNVLKGREAYRGRYIFVYIYLFAFLVVSKKVFYLTAAILGHLLNQGVAFWMNGAVVQRFCASLHTQEAGTLLEGLCTHTGHLEQFATGTESSVLLAVINNVLCQCRT